MNNARIDRSPRLQRVRDLLSDGRKYSTLDIIQGARVCAVNSIVAELRANGFRIDCKRNGGNWEYQMQEGQTHESDHR